MIADNLNKIKTQLHPGVTLVAVSKTYTPEVAMEAYKAGQRIFGENKVQEMVQKYEVMPKDIQWHLIGHLQSNKVKYIAPFVSLIHGVDSEKLLIEINKQGIKNNRIINCLLQIHIAKEESKFGFSFDEASQLLKSGTLNSLKNICVKGFMGMATNTNDKEIINREFSELNAFYNSYKSQYNFNTLSMGMSSDFEIAQQNGSTMVRIGSSIFGNRTYN